MDCQRPAVVTMKYEDMWRLLRENVVQIDMRSREDLKCIQCGNILINACNAPCGCRYCMGCIKDYLDDRDMFCPSGKEECRDQMINYDKDIQIDHPTNKTISKIIVKCPERCCEFKDCLQTIKSHMNTCKFKIDRCPYFRIGCMDHRSVNQNLNDHLQTEHDWHTQLLFWWMDNLDNEIWAINYNLNEMLKSGQENQIETEIQETNKVVKIETFKIRALEYHETRQFERLRSIFQEVDNNVDWVTLDGTYKHDNVSGKLQRSTSSLNTTEAIYKKECDKTDQVIAQKEGNVFLWKIERFSLKRKLAKLLLRTEIMSDAFYSHQNGYKLRLVGYPNGFGDGTGTHLSIAFRIIRGDFDETLSWPMGCEIQIGLVNQETGLILHDQKYSYNATPKFMRYAFERPVLHDNRGYGTSRFITLQELKGIPGICCGNEILIRCSVSLK